MAKGKVDLLIWNKDRTASVSFSKIREIRIYHDLYNADKYTAKAWFNSEEDWTVGFWDTEAEAKEFVDNIHKEVERIATVGITEDRLRKILREVISKAPNHLDADPMRYM